MKFPPPFKFIIFGLSVFILAIIAFFSVVLVVPFDDVPDDDENYLAIEYLVTTEADLEEGGEALGQLYVASSGGSAILRFENPSEVDGDTPYSARITGDSSTILRPRFMHLDAENDRFYLANHQVNNILVFDDISTLSGDLDVKPDRTIESSSFDKVIDVVINLETDEMYISNMNGKNILVFNDASTIDGEVVPDRIISTTPSLNKPHGLYLDTTNDSLYVADLANHEVKVLDGVSELDGEVVPSRTLTGSATSLNQPIYIQMDIGEDLLIVGNRDGVSMNVYADATSIDGNVAPIRMVAGSETTFDRPHQIFYLESEDELYVANAFEGTVVIFSDFSNADGNIAPSRIITGAQTGLDPINENATSAAGIAVDMSR